jgi:hypothetical protein
LIINQDLCGILSYDFSAIFLGATVLDPVKAYYQVPIATLDFASLYPSIMQAYNLCYSTMLSPKEAFSVDADKYKKSENGHIFVKSEVKKGILPIILEVGMITGVFFREAPTNSHNDVPLFCRSCFLRVRGPKRI